MRCSALTSLQDECSVPRHEETRHKEGECKRTWSSAAQPSSSIPHSLTSMDALNRIKAFMSSANAKDYTEWTKENPHEKRKAMANVVGHIQGSMRHALESSSVTA